MEWMAYCTVSKIFIFSIFIKCTVTAIPTVTLTATVTTIVADHCAINLVTTDPLVAIGK